MRGTTLQGMCFVWGDQALFSRTPVDQISGEFGLMSSRPVSREVASAHPRPRPQARRPRRQGRRTGGTPIALHPTPPHKTNQIHQSRGHARQRRLQDHSLETMSASQVNLCPRPSKAPPLRKFCHTRSLDPSTLQYEVEWWWGSGREAGGGGCRPSRGHWGSRASHAKLASKP